jgi:N-acetylneuraminic acid mutarotase
MPDPHVYPEPPSAPLLLPAAAGTPRPTFTSIEQLAAPDPTTPFIPKTMFIRVAMSGPACPGVTSATAPAFYLQADDGEAVLINDHSQPPGRTYPIFSRPGSNPVDFVGEGSVALEDDNVFRLLVAFNDGATQYTWSLGIWNNDGATTRQFTWVVSSTLADTAQPWLHATHGGGVPIRIMFDALVGDTAEDTAQSIEIVNRGTAAVTITDVAPVLAAPYSLSGLPLTLAPNPPTPAVVTLGFAAPDTPAEIAEEAFSFVTANKPDRGPFSPGHNNAFTLRARTSAAHNLWRTRAPMPTPRGYLAMTAAANGKLYAVGGQGGGNQAAIEEYDPATNRWIGRRPMPMVRTQLGLAAARNGRIYVVGGGGNTTGDENVLEYDPATDRWTNKGPMPTPRVFLGVTTARNGKIYAIGGQHIGFGILPTVEEYDPDTNTWTTRAPMRVARQSLGVATAANGKIYAIGGSRNESEAGPRTVEEYDPATNIWTTRAPLPTPREMLGVAAASNGRIYAAGGTAADAAGVNFSTVEEYDPAADRWTTRAPLTTARFGLALAGAANEALYAVGGFAEHIGAPDDDDDTSVFATLEQYLP